MKVVEKFISINGEGVRAGELAVFIRFKGCNLACSYCDTMWANEVACPYQEESPEEIYGYILASGIKNVTLTGGEPLLQPQIKELLALLCQDEQIQVEVETNGSVDISSFITKEARPAFTLDYKLPSSNCQGKMLTDHYQLLAPEDTVKFVCGSKEDLDKALEVIKKYDLLKKCHVYFSPVFGAIQPADMVEFMIEHKLNDARLQIQMHKVIWDPEARGV